MTNAQNAKLVRVTTRALGGSVPDQMPLTSGRENQFDVVVEGIAGNLLSTSGQPYSLEIVAFDVSAGANPHSEGNNFTQERLEEFDAVDGWPSKVATFTVTLNDIAAVQSHLLRYYAILTSANQIVSFVESPLFLLYRHDLKVGRSEPRWGWQAPSAEYTQPSRHSAFSTTFLGRKMNANDVRIARIYTAQPSGVTEDTTPNAGPPRSDTFDLILQLEAGNIIGQQAGNYALTFTAINDDTAAPAPGLNPAGNPFNEQLQAPQWKPSGNDFVRTTPALAAAPPIPATPEILGIARYRITIPAGTTGQFHYNVRFVLAGGQVAAFAQSNLFLLV